MRRRRCGLLAKLNDIAANDPRLMTAAREVGSDVPVCLDMKARMMRGVGDELSPPIALPRLHAVLVNPGVAVATKDVFAALDRRTVATANSGDAAARARGVVRLARRFPQRLDRRRL